MYVYALFTCQAPANNEICPKPLIYSNTTSDSRDYLISEYITGIQLFKAAKRFNFETFMNIYLQVLFSLAVAYHEFDFTHYDLHTGNILVQDLPEIVFIKYTFKNKTFFIKTNKLARIIDYGMGHINVTLGEKDYGFGNFDYHRFHGKNALKSNLLHDIYKFTNAYLDDIQIMSSFPELFWRVNNIITNFNLYKPYVKNEPGAVFIDIFTKARADSFPFPNLLDEDLYNENTVFLDQLKFVRSLHGKYIDGKVLFEHKDLPKDAKFYDCSSSKCVTFNELQAMSQTEVPINNISSSKESRDDIDNRYSKKFRN